MRVTLVTLGDLGRFRNLRTAQARALLSPWEASGELLQLIARDVDGASIHAREVRSALPGGRLVPQGLHALDRLGLLRTHDTILRLFDTGAARALRPSDAVLLHPFPLPRTAARAKSLGAVVVGWGATAHPAFMARAYAAERKRQGLDGSGIPPHAYAGLAAALSSLDVLLVPSLFAAQTYAAAGFPKDRLVTVAPGIDTERFSPPPIPPPKHPLRVVSVAHWTLLKGLPDLLDAWERAAPADAVLEIVGSRDREVRQLCRRRRVPPTVRFFGATDPRNQYHRAHLFVLPSLSEGSSRAVGEAAAAGLPLLATTASGVDHLVTPETGLLVPPSDPAALAAGLTTLLKDPERLRLLGHHAYRSTLEYSLRRFGEQVRAAVEQSCAARRHPSGPSSSS